MTTYESIHLHLKTSDESPPLTESDINELTNFCQEELEPTGEYILHKFEDG